jgi:hypothetical protein
LRNADNIGHARHLVVSPSGVVYVNTWSGVYYGNDKPPTGGFLIALQDTAKSGHADVIKRFGDGVSEGSAGGTGIARYEANMETRSSWFLRRSTGAMAARSSASVPTEPLPLPSSRRIGPRTIC